jgi:hypothetical protein
VVAHLHDRAFAELALDLADGSFQGLVSLHLNSSIPKDARAGASDVSSVAAGADGTERVEHTFAGILERLPDGSKGPRVRNV